MYFVYMHINTTNNKKYVGITSQNPLKRWGNGKNYKKSSHFRKAVEKYGWDCFKHIIVESNLSKEEACKKEKELIIKYKTNDRKYGYNNSIGGEIGSLGNHHKLSKETKEKMSKSKSGVKHWWKSGGRKGGNPIIINKTKPVICIETKQEYESLKEASLKTGISKTCISLNANGKSRQSYAGTLADGTKLHWQFKSTND